MLLPNPSTGGGGGVVPGKVAQCAFRLQWLCGLLTLESLSAPGPGKSLKPEWSSWSHCWLQEVFYGAGLAPGRRDDGLGQ